MQGKDTPLERTSEGRRNRLFGSSRFAEEASFGMSCCVSEHRVSGRSSSFDRVRVGWNSACGRLKQESEHQK